MIKKAKGIPTALFKIFGGKAVKVTDDIVGGAWQKWSGRAANLLNPKGVKPHPTEVGRIIYTPTPWSESIGLRRVGDIFGRAHNNARFMGSYAQKHLDDAHKLLANHPHLQKWLPRVATTAAWTGLGTTIGDGVLEFTGNTDSPLYGLGKYNPYHHLWASEYSPGNWLWSNTTPWGIAFEHGAPWLMGKLQGTMADVGNITIDRTADTLAELGFADRLAYLFDPNSVASKYREQAKRALAEQLGLSGDATKDKALQDVARTVKSH